VDAGPRVQADCDAGDEMPSIYRSRSEFMLERMEKFPFPECSIARELGGARPGKED
jgi:hypothetical protein